MYCHQKPQVSPYSLDQPLNNKHIDIQQYCMKIMCICNPILLLYRWNLQITKTITNINKTIVNNSHFIITTVSCFCNFWRLTFLTPCPYKLSGTFTVSLVHSRDTHSPVQAGVDVTGGSIIFHYTNTGHGRADQVVKQAPIYVKLKVEIEYVIVHGFILYFKVIHVLAKTDFNLFQKSMKIWNFQHQNLKSFSQV